MSGLLCVECGAGIERAIDGCCTRCFLEHTPVLAAPEVLDVELCAHCDARHVGAHWIDPDEGAPLDWIRGEATRQAVQVDPRVRSPILDVEERELDERTFRTVVRLTGDVDGVAVATERPLTVRLRRGVCDRCSRMFGGFYAAIIQLRGTGRDVTQEEVERAHAIVGSELDRQRSTGNRAAFLSRSEPVPGGFDYYMGDIEGTRAITRVLAERLGAAVQEHAKLAGRKDGMDIYRVTFLLRLRRYGDGDFATAGDRVVQVLSIARGRALTIDLEDHKRRKMAEEELERLGGRELLREAVLVSQDARTVQVMDPVSFATLDLRRPEGWEAAGPTVEVLRHEERLYLPAVRPSGGRSTGSS